MSDTPVSLLLVDESPSLEALLREAGHARGYRLVSAASMPDAEAALQAGTIHAALVRLTPGREPGVDALERIKRVSPDTEIIAVSASGTLDSATGSYELAACAFVQDPGDGAQLLAIVERALERRRIALFNRRLFWELQTINEIAGGISRSLELDTVLRVALQRVVGAFDAAAAAIRLRDELTGRYDDRASVGSVGTGLPWRGPAPTASRPSDAVIASRAPVVIDDLGGGLPDSTGERFAIRSAISVPMLAGDELVGTLTVGAARPSRFDAADERLLTIIAGQIVVAVQNARLHDTIRRAKREWESTFDAFADPIAVFDREGVLLRGNAALAQVLGCPVTALRSATCREVGFCGGGCPGCAVGRALDESMSSSAHVTRPGGEIFSVRTFPIMGSHGASVVQVAKNVTEQIRSASRLQQMTDELALTNRQLVSALDQVKATQAQLLQAEKLSAIGQLVAGVAHELNNPLTCVIGYAQLLQEELAGGVGADASRTRADLAQDLQRIAEESERAARIVRNLLAFARRQVAARVPQDVVDLVGRVLSLRTYDLRLNGIELVTRFEQDLPAVVADGGQIQQALLNLVLNAEQAMREESTRRLAVGVRYDQAAAAVELSVADSGHGIDPANLSRIFDPFFTTRDVGEGTGLGLSICYGIIRDHGGEIAVESRPGAGSTFSIRLPARVGVASAASDEILVAHADQVERDFLAASLRGWGFRVVAVGRADEALARSRRGRLHAAVIDRALLGAEVGAWSALPPGVPPLILLTVAGSDGEAERVGRERASAVLVPPFQLRTLWSAVRAIETEKECV